MTGTAEDRLDLLFHALADRTRRALLARLARGAAPVTELAEPFDMSLQAVSKHIRVLERSQLVARTIDGRIHRVSLRVEALDKLERWLVHYRSYWEGQLDSLARHVEQEKKVNRR